MGRKSIYTFMDIGVYEADSFFCTAETNMAL